MLIKTASQQQSVKRHGGTYRRFIELIAQSRWDGQARVNWQTHSFTRAEIARSSWRVECPFCKEAFVYEPGEPFFCPNCLMVSNEGCAMSVIMPESRAEIERILLLRPVPETRNWTTETVAELLIENLEHGDTIPEVAYVL